MSDAALSIKIGGDVKDVVTAIDQTKSKLQELYAKLDEAKRRQDKLIDPKNIQDAGKEISLITKEIDALGNNQGFKTLGESTSGLVKGANDAFSAIRKIAYILPGIGIAGIFSLAFEGVADIIKEVLSAMSDAEIVTKSYGESLAVAGKKIGDVNEDVHRMAALFKDAKDGVVSKTTVLNEYNKKFGDTLGIAKDYNEAEAFFTSKTAAYLDAMKQRAIADAAYGLAKKEIADQIEKNAKNELTFGTTLKASIASLFSITGAGKSFANSIKESDDQSKKLVDSYNKVGDAAEANAQKIAQAAGVNINGKQTVTAPDKPPDTLRATKDALQEIIKLEEDLSKADTRPLFKRLTDSIDDSQAELIQSKIALAIRNNAREGIKQSITDKEVALLNEQLKKLFNPKLLSSATDTSVDDSGFSEEVKKVRDGIAKEFKRIDANAYIHLTIAGFDQDVLKEQAEKIKKLKAEFGKQINSAIGGIASDEIGNFSSAIGDAINGSGDELDGAIKNIASILGAGLKTIGQLYIETAIAIALAKKTFSALAISNPIAAIAVGVGLEILGSVLENTVQQKQAHAFATGGIVTSATLGLVGEAGPEAIIPLKQLDKFIGNTRGASDMRVVFAGRLQGTDIMLSQTRTAKNQRMV